MFRKALRYKNSENILVFGHTYHKGTNTEFQLKPFKLKTLGFTYLALHDSRSLGIWSCKHSIIDRR